jgi:hypothetical protein
MVGVRVIVGVLEGVGVMEGGGVKVLVGGMGVNVGVGLPNPGQLHPVKTNNPSKNRISVVLFLSIIQLLWVTSRECDGSALSLPICLGYNYTIHHKP